MNKAGHAVTAWPDVLCFYCQDAKESLILIFPVSHPTI